MPGDNEATESTVSVIGVVGQLKEFDPRTNNWGIFSKKLKQYFLANAITVDRRQPILLTILNEEAYGLLVDLCLPEEPENKPYEQLIAYLDKHYISKKPSFYEREVFYNCQRELNESPAEWAARVRNLATHCQFGTVLLMALRDKFVTGLRDGPAKTRLYAEDTATLTLERAVEITQATEWAQEHAMTPTSTMSRKMKTEPQEVYRLKKTVRPKCAICGYKNHLQKDCRYKEYQCKKCNTKGHLQKMCPNKSKQVRNNINYVTDYSLELFNIKSPKVTPIRVEVLLNNKKFRLQVDSGAGVTACSRTFWKENFPNEILNKDEVLLQGYDGTQIKPIGYLNMPVYFKNKTEKIKFYVIDKAKEPILGLDWMEKFNVGLANLNYMSQSPEIDKILKKYNVVFSDDLGRFNKCKLKLHLKEDAVPKFCKARPIPFALKTKVEAQLNKLVTSKILTPVTFSEWGTPIVPVLKKDASVRICGDYKVTLNPFIKIDKYPLPRIEDLFANLQGGQEFSKLDLSQAYQQIELDEESKSLTTISTHVGLFNYNRAPFGVASCPAAFQKIMEGVLAGLKGVVVFLDDILITGQNRETHLKNLCQVLERLKNCGLTVKRDKCEFLKQKINYLGYEIDKNGLRTDMNKVKSIVETPIPKDKTQLKSFIGMANFYRKFILNFSCIMKPLYDLTKDQVDFKWEKKCDIAFNTIKNKLISADVLVHYNPSLPIKLVVDASSYGIAGVILHVFPSGVEKPIAFCSNTLNVAQQKYSQLDKEALSIRYAVQKFEQYLFGRKFTLVTDCQPLVAIFGKKKGIPQMSANRLQRYAIYLSGFDFDVQYTRSKTNIADGLSRLPLPEEVTIDTENNDIFLNYVAEASNIKLNKINLKAETGKDAELRVVMQLLNSGEDVGKLKTKISKFYLERWNEFSIEDGCMFWGFRAVIPSTMRETVLQELHSSHMGIVRMKSYARNYVWWPTMNRQIEQIAKSCLDCLKNKDSPEKSPLISWTWPEKPWSRIHCDFAINFYGLNFLIVTCAHSKWLEIFPMRTITSEATIQILRSLFARFGLPLTLVSDGGTQFTSHIFKNFVQNNGITHLTSAVNNPSTNGAAENSVRTFKRAMLSIIGNEERPDISRYLALFLINYRNTVHATTGVSPAQLMLGRPLHTRLDNIRKESIVPINTKLNKGVKPYVVEQQKKQQGYFRGKRILNLEVGKAVMVRDYRHQKPHWAEGHVCQILGQRHALINVEGNMWKRHVNQIRLSNMNKFTNLMLSTPHTTDHTISNNKVTETVNQNIDVGRPVRIRRPPDRLQYE